MTRKLGAERACERNQHERNDDDGQDCVRDQDGEIDGTNPALSSETNDADMQVVIHVEIKKDAGAQKGCNHAGPVQRHDSTAYENIAGEEKERAGGVQASVDGWKRIDVETHRRNFGT